MGITRREFNRLLPAALLSVALLEGCGESRQKKFAPQCLSPSTEDQKILCRFCEAVIPGPREDPTGAPGALEVCAQNFMYDDSLMFRKIAPTVSFMLEQKARKIYGKSFTALTLQECTEVILAVEEEFPQLTLVIRFVKTAFYAGGLSNAGWKYMGYRGPNMGYFNDPQFTFGRPVCRERTSDGIMP